MGGEYEREAQRYRQELERVQWRLELLRQELRRGFTYELRDRIRRYEELEIEMKINIRGMERRERRKLEKEQAEREEKEKCGR